MVTEIDSDILCPKCKSEYTQMIHRRKVVKMFTRKKRFVCLECKRLFYKELSNDQAKAQSQLTRLIC
jgi:transcriptional regulator NrdR family protein